MTMDMSDKDKEILGGSEDLNFEVYKVQPRESEFSNAGLKQETAPAQQEAPSETSQMSVEDQARKMQAIIDQKLNPDRMARELTPVKAPDKMPLGRQSGGNYDSGASSRPSAKAGTPGNRF